MRKTPDQIRSEQESKRNEMLTEEEAEKERKLKEA